MARKRREMKNMGDTYWATAKAFGKACWHCGAASSVALRPRDMRCVCAKCVERTGVKVKGRDVTTVRYECPLCGGPHPKAEHADRGGLVLISDDVYDNVPPAERMSWDEFDRAG